MIPVLYETKYLKHPEDAIKNGVNDNEQDHFYLELACLSTPKGVVLSNEVEEHDPTALSPAS